MVKMSPRIYTLEDKPTPVRWKGKVLPTPRSAHELGSDTQLAFSVEVTILAKPQGWFRKENSEWQTELWED
jgi:hypothetical protein